LATAGILPAVYRSHPCLTYINVFGACCSCPLPLQKQATSRLERGMTRLRQLICDV